MNLDDIPMSPHDDQAKRDALIGYVFMLLGLFTGIFWIIGAVWAMAKTRDAQGSIFYDHFRNITGIFWWGLGISLIGFVLAIFFIGYLLLLGIWIWSIVKLVKGILRLTNNLPYHDAT
ncbi:DUF4870 family protein [Marinomonas atlantica]|uniref:DUF4870 family protein n=1 Tax=Marinomonas atlantica TaxID=1806668 RepID=UPI00082FA854|nr:YIP1 family protein [Marinomonas atlantica]